MAGNRRAVNLLLDAKADPNRKGRYGSTFLESLARREDSGAPIARAAQPAVKP